MIICDSVSCITKKENFFEVATNGPAIRIYFITDSIIRIRAGFDGNFKEHSYSLVNTAWEDECDNLLSDERNSIFLSEATLDGNRIIGSKLIVEIEEKPFTIKIYDVDGNLLHQDLTTKPYLLDSNNRRSHNFAISMDDYFFGLGEKTGSFNKIGNLYNMNPGDCMGYDATYNDSLYKHIPFFIRYQAQLELACGYYYHNTYPATFDFAHSHSNYWSKRMSYTTEGGDIDLFFCYGPSIKDVVSEYTFLTGNSAMLPKYALGYLGSSMYYAELDYDCDDAILKFCDTVVAKDIPIDGFQLSSGYTSGEEDNKRYVFNWNYKRFKDPANWFSEMTKRGITVSPNVKPGLLLTHPKMDEFKGAKAFVLDSTKDEPATGIWWGGEGHFVDLTNPLTRDFWKKELKKNVIDYGTTSIWNDNCEYDSIIDTDARVDFEGYSSTLHEAKPVMANIMCKITNEAILESDANVRPYIVCRGGMSGIQRYAQTWSGDNSTSWTSLKYNMPTMLNMALSGVSNYGSDIGGFYGTAPEPELFVRWVQNGIFQPRFSIHSVNTDNSVTEPWMYPAVTPLIRDAIKLRYRLFPYYYSLMRESNKNGLPILRPLCMNFASDISVLDEGFDFTVGDSLFVSNILDKGEDVHSIYFPEGACYYPLWHTLEYQDDKDYDPATPTCFVGGNVYDFDVDLSDIPMFLVSGGIIPVAKNQMMNLTKESVLSIALHCAIDKDGTFEMYEDDGLTNDYKNGSFKNSTITMTSGALTTIEVACEGSYESTIKEVELVLYSSSICPKSVYISDYDGEAPQFFRKEELYKANVGWMYDMQNSVVRIKYPNVSGNYSVKVDFGSFDMLGM